MKKIMRFLLLVVALTLPITCFASWTVSEKYGALGSSSRWNLKARQSSQGYGVLEGFIPTAAALSVTLTAGKALSYQGVLMEQSASTTVTVVTNVGTANPRYDAIVLTYSHVEQAGADDPVIEIEKGNAAASPEYPSLDANQLLLAVGHMAAEGTTYDAVYLVPYISKIVNLDFSGTWSSDNSDYGWTLVDGSETAYLEYIDRNDDKQYSWIIPGGNFADDAVAELGDSTNEISNTTTVFVGAGEFDKTHAGASDFMYSGVPYLSFADATDEIVAACSFKIPRGKYTINSIKVLYKNEEPSTAVYVSFATSKSRVGAVVTTDDGASAYIANSTPANDNYIESIVVPSSYYNGVGTVQESDVISFAILRDSDDVSDTYDDVDGVWNVLGILVELKKY